MNTCDCLDKIKAKLIEKYGPEVNLELAETINVETGVLGATWPPLFFTYMVGKKKKRSFIKFSFCPFCGKKPS